MLMLIKSYNINFKRGYGAEEEDIKGVLLNTSINLPFKVGEEELDGKENLKGEESEYNTLNRDNIL